jgi:hypothetical protein
MVRGVLCCRAGKEFVPAAETCLRSFYLNGKGGWVARSETPLFSLRHGLAQVGREQNAKQNVNAGIIRLCSKAT